jgi:hypothetical protein
MCESAASGSPAGCNPKMSERAANGIELPYKRSHSSPPHAMLAYAVMDIPIL